MKVSHQKQSTIKPTHQEKQPLVLLTPTFCRRRELEKLGALQKLDSEHAAHAAGACCWRSHVPYRKRVLEKLRSGQQLDYGQTVHKAKSLFLLLCLCSALY